MKKNNYKASQGFSLIELLLVLAIIAALAVAAFVIYPRVQAGRAATYEAQVLSSAQASVKGLFQSNNFASLSDAVAIQAKVFPESMVDSGTGFRNQFGGFVLVGAAADVSGANPAPGARAPFFRFVYEEVPAEVCQKLGGSASSNFAGILVGPTGGTGTVVKSSTVSFTEAALVTACGDTTATMTFVSN